MIHCVRWKSPQITRYHTHFNTTKDSRPCYHLSSYVQQARKMRKTYGKAVQHIYLVTDSQAVAEESKKYTDFHWVSGLEWARTAAH